MCTPGFISAAKIVSNLKVSARFGVFLAFFSRIVYNEYRLGYINKEDQAK